MRSPWLIVPKRWLVILLAMLVSAPALANTPQETAIAGPFRNLSIIDGLPSLRIFSIAQDRFGFLWLATQNGLVRFDGHELQIFRHRPEDPTSLPDNYVTSLQVTADGDIWIGTSSGTLAHFDPATEIFSAVEIDLPEHCSGAIHNLLVLDDGSALVSNGSGLHRVGLMESREAALLLDCDEAVTKVRQLDNGAVWIASTQGLLRWRQSWDAPRRIPGIPPLQTLCVIQGERLVLALTEGGGLLDFDPATDLAVPSPINAQLSTQDPFSTCFVDRDETLWLSYYPLGTSASGLLEVSAARDRVIHHAPDPLLSGKPADRFYLDIFQDRTGVLWFGGFAGGVERLDPRRRGVERHVHIPHRPSSLAAGHVLSIDALPDGGAWVGFFGDGIQRLDSERRPAEHWNPQTSALRNGFVWDLMVDDAGELWIAHEAGVERLAASTFTPVEGLAVRSLALFESRVGELWVGGSDFLGRIDRSDRAAPRFVPWPLDEPLSSVLAINESSDGHLWIGFDGGGLWRIDPTRGMVQQWDSTQLGHGVVSSIYPASDNAIWISTLGVGLVRIDSKTGELEHFSVDAGLSSTSIKGVAPGTDSELWLATDRGIDRFDPASGSVRQFDVHDGLPARGFVNKAFGAASGRLWFGSYDGLVTFQPRDLTLDIPPPAASLTWLEVVYNRVGLFPADPNSPLEQPIYRTEAISLSHRDRVVSLGFTALDLGAPERHRFRYQLEGFDHGWVETDADECFARYSSLPAGRFTFRVEASLDGEHWGQPAVLEVLVRPPWWRSRLAIGLYVGLVLGMVGTVFTIQRRQVRTLGSLLPICASCKKIRDDGGYWQEVEAYVTSSSGALFSHGLCPGCFDRSLAELDQPIEPPHGEH